MVDREQGVDACAEVDDAAVIKVLLVTDGIKVVMSVFLQDILLCTR